MLIPKRLICLFPRGDYLNPSHLVILNRVMGHLAKSADFFLAVTAGGQMQLASGVEARGASAAHRWCAHTHTRTHAHTHARTHTRTHARTHARTHTHAQPPATNHPHGQQCPCEELCCLSYYSRIFQTLSNPLTLLCASSPADTTPAGFGAVTSHVSLIVTEN